MTELSHPIAAAPIRVRAARIGGLAGMIAGPLFLSLVALNSLASIDFLHSVGWQLIGGNDLPWPSCLALGPHGWVQVANFLAAGLLVILFARGLRQELPRGRIAAVGAALLALFGAGVMASAARVDWTSVHGGDPSTVNGWVHGIAFLVAMPSALLATIALAVALRHHPRWRPLSLVSALTGPALILSAFAGPHGQGTFFVFLTILFGWVFVLARRLYRLS